MKTLSFVAILALSATSLHAGSYASSESFSESAVMADTVEKKTTASSIGTNTWLILLLVAGAAVALKKK